MIVFEKCLRDGIKLNAEFRRKEGWLSFVSALLANIYIFGGLILINLKIVNNIGIRVLQ